MTLRSLTALMVAIMLAACSATVSVDDTADANSENSSDIVANEPTDVPAQATVEQPTQEIIAPTDIDISNPPTFVPTTPPQPTAIPPTADTSAAASDTSDSSYAGPEWANITLVNAATGVEFTLADFAGQTVFVEPMATWCSNCFAQQTRVSEAMNQLDANEFVFISLSVGENVNNETLAAYAERNGFQQIFVVAPQALSNALVNAYGFAVTTPPSTPHFTISPTGTTSDLNTGAHSIQEIIDDVVAAQTS